MSRLPILMYHSIDSSGSVISISKKKLSEHLQILRKNAIEVISLRDALQLLGKNLPAEKKAVLTFDDGFENFYTDAFPLLAESQIPATVFLVTDYCAKTNQW